VSGRQHAGELADLVAALGGEIPDDLALRAVTHRSFAYENGGLPTNERLEFLGDSVLGLVITEELYQRHPDLPEGQLAKLRAAVVNSRALAEVARALGVGGFLRLGRGEEASGGRDKSSILADALEALIGAVYLARGLEHARTQVLTLFAPLLASAARLGAGLDWKTSLQELAAEQALGVPDYRVSEAGPDHAKEFHAVVVVGGRPVGEGDGRSKKEAEQRAAEQAWTALSDRLSETLSEGDGPTERELDAAGGS
jgi:ribonuclease-3